MEDKQGTRLEHVVKSEPLLTKSWPEIRASFLRESFSSFARTILDTIKQLEIQPRSRVSVEEWNRDVRLQVEKARGLPRNGKFKEAAVHDSGTKISVIGSRCPEVGKGILTRLYIGLDPRKGADAFISLVEELNNEGVLSEINSALNMEELGLGRLSGNMIILYEPLSRPDILDKIVIAYRRAKDKNPNAFSLTPRQRASILRENLRQYKEILDANLSFVEMAEEDGPVSYDSGAISQINNAFNVNPILHLTDDEWLTRINQRVVTGIVLTRESQREFDRGKWSAGAKFAYKRKLSAPALIQKGFISAN